MKRRGKAILMIASLIVFLTWWDWMEREKTVDSIIGTIQTEDAESFVQAGIDSAKGNND